MILHTYKTLLLLLVFLAGTGSIQAQEVFEEAADYAAVAKRHFEKQQDEKAKSILDTGIEKYPKDSDLRFYLGKYYFHKKDYVNARYQLIKSLEYNSSQVLAKQLLVQVETDAEHYSSAICYINELLEVNPYWKGLWLKKIEVYKKQGNQVEATRLLVRLKQIYPDDNDIARYAKNNLEEVLIEKRKQGQHQAVAGIAESLLESEPKNEEAYLEVINNQLQLGNLDKALAVSNRGLIALPASQALIAKKTGILTELNRHDEVLSFLNPLLKQNRTAELQKLYDYTLLEQARLNKQQDPYVIYGKIYQKNPSNKEAFDYLLATAMTKGYYDDALMYLKQVQRREGVNKKWMYQEYQVYKRLGESSKANALVASLYELDPSDSDIKEAHLSIQIDRAKALMAESDWKAAIPLWKSIRNQASGERKQQVEEALFTACYQSGRMDWANQEIDNLILQFPNHMPYREKKAMVYVAQNQYEQALDVYRDLLAVKSSQNSEELRSGYEEIALIYCRKLMENQQYPRLLEQAQSLVEVQPDSDLAYRFALGAATELDQWDTALQWAQRGGERFPNELFYAVKQVQLALQLGDYNRANNLLESHLLTHPWNKELNQLQSSWADLYAASLVEEKQYDQALQVVEAALKNDAKSVSLQYRKGLILEKLKRYQEAFEFQKVYQPALAELGEFQKKMDWLQHQSYKNQFGMYHLHSRYTDQYETTAMTTLEYTRLEENNTYTARINYAGRGEGAAIQPHLEWHHTWTDKLYSRLDVAVGDKYFPKWTANASLFAELKREFEVELGLGTKRMLTDKQLFSAVAGLSKSWDMLWLNARVTGLNYDGSNYYNLVLQSRFYLWNAKSYLTAVAGMGSAPESEMIDYQLFNAWTTTNTMMGIGAQYLFSSKLSLGLMGNWYNLKNDDQSYKDLYNLYLQLRVSF